MDQEDAIADLQTRRQDKTGPGRREWQGKHKGEWNGHERSCAAHDGDRPESVGTRAQHGVPRCVQDGREERKTNDDRRHCGNAVRTSSGMKSERSDGRHTQWNAVIEWL